MQSIGDLVDIASPSKDNDNRHTVLKFLYTFITSVEFDDPLTPREQTTALMMFFRVLNSTSSRPAFLETDWCTPQLATKFVRLSVWYHMSDADERCTYFFQHTSFTNETLASFVSDLFEELRTDIEDVALWSFLRLIIIRLGSEDLGVHIRQQSLEYLHEPTICSFLALPSFRGMTPGLFVVSLSSILNTVPGPAVYSDWKTLKWKNHESPISRRLSKLGVWVHLGRMTRHFTSIRV